MVKQPVRHSRFTAVVAATAVLGLIAGCGESTRPVRVPALPSSFLFVSGAPGQGQIYRWYTDSVVPLTAGPGENVEPSAASGRLAFASYRDGNSEIYLAAVNGADQHRVVTSSAFDNQPDLSPDATRLVFVSTRTGAQRLYVADSSGLRLAPLLTGTVAGIPETSPAWSPDGRMIAFASSRTGTSQIFTVPAAGGAAIQHTRESLGAFDPSWSSDGDTIFFVASAASTEIRAVRIASGSIIAFPRTGEGYGQPACGSFGCLAVRGPYGGIGELVVLQLNGRRVTVVDSGSGPRRDPALIR